MRGALVAAVLMSLTALPAAAQTPQSPSAGSTAGNVGSASLRNGYPTGGGAITLPSIAGVPSAAAAAGSSIGTAAPTGGPSSGGGARSGNTANANTANGSTATSASARPGTGSRRRGSGGWVLCPPSAASGEAAFFTGTDLSCAPD
jgi:hypothetical protein